jgi:acetyl-CoA carboxylase biotin carboxyl carrier protein
MELKDLYAMMDRFEKSGLSELIFKKGGDEICLKKVITAAPAVQPMPAPQPQTQAARAQSASADPPTTPGTELICSPLVGTFYRSPAPDAPPFVEKGDTVKKGGPLCILEAMKLMNEYQAEFDMEIVSILGDNGKMVEFGAPLFEVRRI